MHDWDETVTGAVAAAIDDARSGAPVVVVVEGLAGAGKSTLLADAISAADGFRVVAIDGFDQNVSPFQALKQAGLLGADTSGEGPAPLAVAESLRGRLDELAAMPLLLKVDDLQWVDPESVDALTWLLRRLAGDRILTLVASRPLPDDLHVAWQRWTRTSSTVRRLTLHGLDEDAVLRLAATRWPSISRFTAERLRAHTEGNPLYLTALLDEYDEDELLRMNVLPAPAQFERLTLQQLSRLPDEVVEVVRSAAVLGDLWTPLPLIAAVSFVKDIDRGVQLAADIGLLQVRSMRSGVSVRFTHALVRAAVYHSTPLPQLRRLHRRASAAVSDVTAALEHRVHATDAWNDELADELEARAEVMHGQRSHRVAGQLLEWSSNTTSDPFTRARRYLDSRYEAALVKRELAGGNSREPVDTAGHDNPEATLRTALLDGLRASFAGHPDDAVRILAPATRTAPDPTDAQPYGRAKILLAWARMLAGGTSQAVLTDLAEGTTYGPIDPALSFYAFYSRGIATARDSSPEALVADIDFLPESAADISPEQHDLLSWRGNMRLFMGMVPEAASDMRAAIKYYETIGGHDLRSGGPHAALGVAYWLNGQWDLAKVAFDRVHDAADEPVAIVYTYLPLYPIGIGDFDTADRLLANAVTMFERMPWQEAVQHLLIPRVARAHAGADAAQQATILCDMRRRWPRAFVDSGLVSSLWVLHAALAAIWAEDTAYATAAIDRLARPGGARWCPAARAWLRALLVLRHGDAQAALDLLRDSTAMGAPDIPLYYAHMLTDHARVAAQLGLGDEATRAAQRAQQIYRSLGATPYLDQPSDGALAAATTPATRRSAFNLTERERDISALIATGMSYAQIARELFITRSTVNYHLGNIYAKAGVRSRHELSHLLRTAAHT